MVLTGADTKISFLWHNLSSECGLIMTPAAGPHLDCHHSSLSLCQSFNHRAQPTEPGREHLAPAPTQETREQVGGDWWPVQHRRDKTSLSKWGHIDMYYIFVSYGCGVCVYSISYYYINKGTFQKKNQLLTFLAPTGAQEEVILDICLSVCPCVRVCTLCNKALKMSSSSILKSPGGF